MDTIKKSLILCLLIAPSAIVAMHNPHQDALDHLTITMQEIRMNVAKEMLDLFEKHDTMPTQPWAEKELCAAIINHQKETAELDVLADDIHSILSSLNEARQVIGTAQPRIIHTSSHLAERILLTQLYSTAIMKRARDYLPFLRYRTQNDRAHESLRRNLMENCDRHLWNDYEEEERDRAEQQRSVTGLTLALKEKRLLGLMNNISMFMQRIKPLSASNNPTNFNASSSLLGRRSIGTQTGVAGATKRMRIDDEYDDESDTQIAERSSSPLHIPIQEENESDTQIAERSSSPLHIPIQKDVEIFDSETAESSEPSIDEEPNTIIGWLQARATHGENASLRHAQLFSMPGMQQAIAHDAAEEYQRYTKTLLIDAWQRALLNLTSLIDGEPISQLEVLNNLLFPDPPRATWNIRRAIGLARSTSHRINERDESSVNSDADNLARIAQLKEYYQVVLNAAIPYLQSLNLEGDKKQQRDRLLSTFEDEFHMLITAPTPPATLLKPGLDLQRIQRANKISDAIESVEKLILPN